MVHLHFKNIWSDSGSEQLQSQRAYRRILDTLSSEGVGPLSVVRLDHFASSQEWLGTRQQERALAFGKPARLASTGVRVRLPAGCHLAVGAVAVSGAKPKLVIPGADYGMPWIATAVEAGDLVFVSGILSGPDQASESGAGSAIEHCLQQIQQILRQAGDPSPLRIDAYAETGTADHGVRSALQASFGPAGTAALVTPLIFEGGMQVEVTMLASRLPVVHREDGPWLCSIGTSCASAWTTIDQLPGRDAVKAMRALSRSLDMTIARVDVSADRADSAAEIAVGVSDALDVPTLAYGHEALETRIALWLTPGGM